MPGSPRTAPAPADFPPQWRPTDPAQVQLVACIQKGQPTDETVGTCDYHQVRGLLETAPADPRVLHVPVKATRYHVFVYEARTGRQVDSSSPPTIEVRTYTCPSEVTPKEVDPSAGPVIDPLTADEPSPAQYRQVLAALVG